MIYSLLADAVLLFHLAFILFALFGSLLLRRFPRLIWLHLPAAIWAGVIELVGFVCPLTPLENHLRRLGGEIGYSGSFIEHYLLPVIYPSGLSHEIQVGFGLGVIVINVVAYGLLRHRIRRHER